jgi:NitT/TauT family transport system substrate-binding protein
MNVERRLNRKICVHRTAILLAGCLLAAFVGTHRAAAQNLEHVTVRLDWLAGADHTSIFLAAARGYYKEKGIDIEINDGKGSVGTIQAVGAGSDMIGLASLSQVAIAIGKGVPLISIAGIVQKAPDAVIALKGTGILKPKDIEGKRWALIPDDSGARIFPAFAAANGIDMSKVQKIQVSYSTIYSVLLQGNADFITGWATSEALKIGKQKPIEPPIVFSDYGVNSLGTGIFVTKETAAKREKLLRDFLEATVRGAEETEKDPAAGVDAIMKMRPSSDRAVIADEYAMLPPYLHTKNSAGHGYGWMAKADWDQTREILQKYFDLHANLEVAQFYTNEYLPKQ